MRVREKGRRVVGKRKERDAKRKRREKYGVVAGKEYNDDGDDGSDNDDGYKGMERMESL